MKFENFAAKYFAMSDDVWARHANPWSVWTRYSCLPLLLACLWWRDALQGWFWPLLVVLVLWVWFNPRCFKKPLTTENWASQSVLGERILLYQRDKVAAHHTPVLTVITSLLTIFTALCVSGLFFHEPISTCMGALGLTLTKTWFLDRMVWIYRETTSQPLSAHT
ncbi:hypothetical protein N480_15440 [Pseudoalteromonas luteoviolacea S2607]|uniref:DUF6653 family protein n=1 Tax=Pseudoalteromonas luteoviolacea TaxID=43657 RepID=UPI0007B0B676|nr:DUF6653 family protein [Pseudoalteromonas luteoviolacea]KZN37184.1 hypothetical protein N480_15440 [Pseudoalteromonas luteoviolacea S2607]